MSSRVFSDPRPTLRLSDGVTPNSLGKIYFYEPGAGSTVDKPVYSDADLTIAMTQPIILNTAGKCPLIYPNGDYRVVITDKNDVVIDDIPSYQRAIIGSQFEEWTSYTTYAIYDKVRGSDGNYYESLSSGNKGNDPVTTSGKWVKTFSITEYSSIKSFNTGEICIYNDRYYKSLTDSNLGNTPNSSRSKWILVNVEDWFSDQSYDVNDRSYYLGVLYRCILASTNNQPDISPTYWVSVAADPDVLSPPVAGYLRSGFTSYLQEDGGFLNSFSVSLTLTNQDPFLNWETVGPTGSGADYIWTALDGIPTNAKSVLLRVRIYAERNAGSDDNANILLYCKPHSSTLLSPDNRTRIAGASTYGGATFTGVTSNVTEITVPVSSDRILDFVYTEVNSDTTDVTLILFGYQA